MTTTILARINGHKPTLKQKALRQRASGNVATRSTLPEYLEPPEVDALIHAAPHGQARLIMLEQWRAGLRVSEAVALEVADLQLDGDQPTLRVRQGKGSKDRVVPVHPELAAAFRQVIDFGNVAAGGHHEVNGVAMGQRGPEPRPGVGHHSGWKVGWDSYLAAQRRSALAGQRGADQPRQPVAGPCVDCDYAGLPGDFARPHGVHGPGAVIPAATPLDARSPRLTPGGLILFFFLLECYNPTPKAAGSSRYLLVRLHRAVRCYGRCYHRCCCQSKQHAQDDYCR